MKITSEDVKAVQQRVDVTYEEAEKYLIKANGNVDQAIYMINQKRDSGFSRFMDEVKRIFSELLTYYFKVEKKDKVFIDIPLLIVVMFFTLVNLDTKIWVLVVGIGLILLSESQVSIFKVAKEEDGLVKREKPEQQQKDSIPTPVVPVQPPEPELAEDEDDDDDYHEITIEK